MRKRMYYFIMIIISIVLGLASRYFSQILPKWVNLYLGDILYAVMFYNIFAFIFIDMDRKKVLLLSMAYCIVIELSQLYQGDLINRIRNTTIGHLLLGKGFLFSDIICYIFGSTIGYILDINIKR